jgi:hypothetical protein
MLHPAIATSCSRTEAIAAVAARMSQDFAGYFSYKLHASLRISMEAEYKLRGQSDQTRNFRVFAVAGCHPGFSITFFTFFELKFPAAIVYISAPGGRSCSWGECPPPCLQARHRVPRQQKTARGNEKCNGNVNEGKLQAQWQRPCNGCALHACIAIAIARQWPAVYHVNSLKSAALGLARPRKA